jgi:hypothetical protein
MWIGSPPHFLTPGSIDFLWSYLIEVLIVTFVALLPFRTRKYPSLRSARSTFFGSGYAR